MNALRTRPHRLLLGLPALLAVAAVRLYRWTVSPLLGDCCKFHPSCSQYALDALRGYGFVRGTILAGWRVLRCNPWSHGGVDYAADQTLFRGARKPRVEAAP